MWHHIMLIGLAVSIICGFSMSPLIAGMVDDFEDGDFTQNPAWSVSSPWNGERYVATDPLRPANHVLQLHGTNEGGGVLITDVAQSWSGFYYSVEYSVTPTVGNHDNCRGDATLSVGSSSYGWGTRLVLWDDGSVDWMIQEAGFTAWEDPGRLVLHVQPTDEWWRVILYHNPSDGLIYGELRSANDNRLIAARSYVPRNGFPAIGLAEKVYLSCESPNWQYMDNVYLAPEPATLVLLALGGLTIMRRERHATV